MKKIKNILFLQLASNRTAILLFVIAFITNSNNIIYAQDYETTWFIGGGQSVNFSSGSPLPGGIPNFLNPYYAINNGSPPRATIAVSNATGDLQFFVQIRAVIGNNAFSYTNSAQKVFDANGQPFPNGTIKANLQGPTVHSGNPIVVPDPANNKKYFLFYVQGDALLYSVVDMSLNNGMGDIDPNQKDIMFTGYGIVIGYKVSAIAGCRNVWLVARSRIANEYLSFKIDENGVDATPVISECGDLPVNTYIFNGLMKASNNNEEIAVATISGVELYDFEKCSGKLKNARLIDTMQSYGVCFSPDDSKLYVSHNTNYNGFWQGEIYQYDLNQPDLQSITASKTIVMRNHLYLTTGMFPILDTGPFGDLKLGSDGKIYVGNNNTKTYSNAPCSIIYPPNHEPIPLPSSSNCLFNQRLYVIHNPNQAGTACNAELDYLELPDSNNNATGLLLQNDIIAAPITTPDTIPGNKYVVTVCFKDSETLSANENSSCRHWDNGSSELQRTVNSSGTYWVGYFQDCTYQTDTFLVDFIPLPKINAQYFGCEGDIQFTINAIDGITYTYTLRNESNEIEGEANSDVVFQQLNSGNYNLQIKTNSNCDTTIPITLNAYPPAEIQVYPQEATITYGDSIQLNASGAELYHWWPSGPLSYAIIANPWARPFESTLFTVLGITQYGCKDSAKVKINIDYTMPELIPNAFSPNGDGLNDVFRIEGISYQMVLVFQVFNRFGQVVFSTNKSDVGWDGRFNGKVCDVGVYYYFIKLAYPDGKERSYKGDIQLIR